MLIRSCKNIGQNGSRNIEVTDSFDDMNLKPDLLRGTYSEENIELKEGRTKVLCAKVLTTSYPRHLCLRS